MYNEVESYVKPTTDTLNAVNVWLSSEGISFTTTSPAGDWLSISIPVSKANEIFDTEFGLYTDNKTGTFTALCFRDGVELIDLCVARVS